VGRVRELLDHLHAGVWTGLQRGLEAALRDDGAGVAARAAVYRDRRDRAVAALGGLGLVEPEGSFFAWLRLPDGLDAAGLMRRAHVGVAPGEGFGARGAGYVRLSLAVPDAELDAALGRLAAALR
jgi:L-glutamine---4-(methylsulfanyl)-2-oxobutanoate aminotransferase